MGEKWSDLPQDRKRDIRLTLQAVDESFCAKCEQYKPITEFTKNKTSANGLHAYCKECITKRNQEQRKNNPDAYRIRNAFDGAKRKAKKYGCIDTLTYEQLEHLYHETFGFSCMLTGEQDGTIEHLKPLSLGGPNSIENIIVVSSAINKAHNNRNYFEIIEELATKHEFDPWLLQTILEEKATQHDMTPAQYKKYLGGVEL